VSFVIVEPTDLEAALDALNDDRDGAPMALAGATAFVLLMRQGLIRPTRVVSLSRLTGLRGIRRTSDGLWIGAMATHHEIETSPLVRHAYPSVAEAFASIATIRIRNQATIGGNLAHADPAQDPPPILIALDASVDVVGPSGRRRTLPVESLFVDFFTTVLEPHELIVGVTLPATAPEVRTAYRKFLPRSADDYATVAVAASIGLDADGRVERARIALAGAGPTVLRAHQVEAALVGAKPTAARVRDAAHLVREIVDPLDDVRGTANYKREMAAVWTDRTISAVVA
jgi:aerobic carbon-monoxide dehydrogenase medium subunit